MERKRRGNHFRGSEGYSIFSFLFYLQFLLPYFLPPSYTLFRYAYKFTPTTEGQWAVHATLCNKDITFSPFTFKVREATSGIPYSHIRKYKKFCWQLYNSCCRIKGTCIILHGCVSQRRVRVRVFYKCKSLTFQGWVLFYFVLFVLFYVILFYVIFRRLKMDLPFWNVRYGAFA